MITKHRVSNNTTMRGERDVALRLLRQRDKENISHKGTEASSNKKPNIGVMFDTPQPALPVHTKTNGKTINMITAVFPLSPRCWHLTSPGESEYFTLDRSPPPPSTVSPVPSPETRGGGGEGGNFVRAGWRSFLICCRIVGTSQFQGGRNILLWLVLLLRHQQYHRIRLLRQGEEEKKKDASSVPDDGGFSLVAALLALLKSRGVRGFSFGSSSTINSVTGSVSAFLFGVDSLLSPNIPDPRRMVKIRRLGIELPTVTEIQTIGYTCGL